MSDKNLYTSGSRIVLVSQNYELIFDVCECLPIGTVGTVMYYDRVSNIVAVRLNIGRVVYLNPRYDKFFLLWEKPNVKVYAYNNSVKKLLNAVSEALHQAKQSIIVTEMFQRAMSAGSYSDSLEIVSDYVNIEFVS